MNEAVRDARAGGTVSDPPGAVAEDGLEVAESLRPTDAAALADQVGDAAAAGRALLVHGAGTRFETGNPALRADVRLDTRGLSGIDELDADEGVVRAWAGTPLAELREKAVASGHELPFDPPGEGTLGGTLASAAAGLRFANVRDAVLGLDVVLGSGEATRSGGRVVKNVTGYDLAKLHVGAFGSLGVITAAWIRLRPAPEAVRVFEGPAPDARASLAAARLATARAAAIHDGRLIVELAGDAPSVEADRERLPVREETAAERVDALRDVQGGRAVLRVRVTGVASGLPAAAACLEGAGGVTLSLPAQGLLYAAFDDSDPKALGAALEAAGRAAGLAGGELRIERAPLAVRRAHDVFGDPGPLRGIHRALKQRFDPAGILNPGRFAGRL